MQELDLNTQSLGQDNIRVLLDEKDNIVACAFIQVGYTFSEIFVLGVKKDFQGKGLGTIFVDNILNEIRDFGCFSVGVEPYSENAYKFWIKMKFIPIPYAYGNYGFLKLKRNL